jgi:hypothetical protein
MNQSLMERYDDRIAGVLSCYDRVVITGTLPTVCYAEGMTRFLHASGIRIFDYPAFAQTLRDRVRDGAAALAATGATIEHLAKSHIRKEEVVQRVLKQRGDHPGLVHIISALARQADTQDLHPAGQRQMPALLLLFHGCRVRTDLPPGAHILPVPAAVLLQRS